MKRREIEKRNRAIKKKGVECLEHLYQLRELYEDLIIDLQLQIIKDSGSGPLENSKRRAI